MKDKKMFTRRNFLKSIGIFGAAAVSFDGAKLLLSGPERAWASSDEIKIGVLSDITGAWSVYGQALSNNVLLAAKEINEAGGINNKALKVFIEDSATVPKTGVEKSRKLVEYYDVDVVIGSISSAMRNAVKSVITIRNNKILFYPELYEGFECHKNIFCTGPVPPQQVNPFIPWLMEKFGKKFYIVGMDYIWPHRTNRQAIEVIERLGGTVLGEEYLPFGTSDFSTVINHMKAKKPDVLFSTYPGTDWLTFVNQMYSYGLMKDMAVATPFMRELEIQGLKPEVEEGIATCLEYFMAIDTKKNKEYLKRYADMFGSNTLTVSVGAAAYNSLYLFKQGVEKSGGSLKTDDLRKTIKHSTFENAPGGPIEMVPDQHHCNMNMYIGQVTNGKYNIVKNLGVLPPNQTCKL